MRRGWISKTAWVDYFPDDGTTIIIKEAPRQKFKVFIVEADKIKEIQKALREVAERLNTEKAENLRNIVEWAIDELEGEE